MSTAELTAENGGPKIKVEGKEGFVNAVEAVKGIYLFDVLSGERALLVPGGRSAIASPIMDQIAYEKENSIRVMDLTTGTEKTICKYTSREILRGKHLKPDGKNIYLAYTYKWGVGNMFNMREKLMEANRGRNHLKKMDRGSIHIPGSK